MKTIIAALSAALMLTVSAQADESVIALSNVEPAAVEGSLNKIKSLAGTVISTPGSNKIVLIDTPEAIARMKRYIAAVDVPRKQVMIEARIMEAQEDFTRSLGVNWGVHSTDSGKHFPGIQASHSSFGGIASVSAPITGVSGAAGVVSDMAFGVIGKNVMINLRVNAAASAETVKIISSPKIATRSGSVAKIAHGVEIPYTSATSDKIETRFVEAALSLEVTPTVREDGSLLMNVAVKNDAAGAAGMHPAITRKYATTSLVLKDGQTMVIGGISKSKTDEGDNGVPWLKDIPLLGHLFKSDYSIKNKTELMVLITPRVITE